MQSLVVSLILLSPPIQPPLKRSFGGIQTLWGIVLFRGLGFGSRAGDGARVSGVCIVPLSTLTTPRAQKATCAARTCCAQGWKMSAFSMESIPHPEADFRVQQHSEVSWNKVDKELS
jgi:hypothetical protein